MENDNFQINNDTTTTNFNSYSATSLASQLINFAWWIMELPSGKVTFSKNKTDVLGFDSQDFNHYEDFMKLVHPDDYEKTMQAMRDLIEGRTNIYKIEYRIRDINNNYHIFYDFGNILEKNTETNFIKIVGYALEITEYKTLLDKIFDQDNRFKALMHALPDWIFVTNKEGVYKYFWSTNYKYLLMQPKDFLNKHYSNVLPDFLSKKISECYSNLFKTGEQQVVEYELDFNGDKQFFEARFVLCGSEEVLMIVRNITEKQNVYNKLYSSEKKYKDLFNLFRLLSDNTTDMIWAKDLNRNFIFVNKSFCDNLLSATDIEEPIGKNDLYFANREKNKFPDNPNWHTFGQICVDSDAVTLEANKPMNFIEHGYIKGVYTYLDVHKAPLYDANGNLIGVVGTARDITEQIKINDRLKTLYHAFEQSQTSIVITDKQGNIEYVNPSFCIKSGYTEPEVIGKNMRFLKSGYTTKEEYDLMYSKLNNGEKYTGLFLNKKKNGELFWENENIAPVKDENGNITHFVAVKEDVTDKKKLELELINSLEKAKESAKLKEYFLANINHELRTPLNSILGFAKILTEQLINEDHLSMAIDILESAKRLSTSLNLIIDLANMEANKESVQLTQIELSDLIKECFEDYKIAALNKKLDYKLILNFRPIYASIDKNYLITAIKNIIENAIKFTDKGEIIVQLDFNKDTKTAMIYVKDSGIGIPEEKLDIIFEPFRQVSEGTTRLYEGTGLGLSLAKKAIEYLNGNIKVQSEVNKGTVFTIFLPVADYKKPQIEQVNINSPKTNKIKNILYVEDDEININVVKMFLKGKYIIDTAMDPVTALEKTKQNSYDAILMDINLGPGISGADLAKTIKEQERYKNTPIIAVTAYTTESQKESFFEKGCTHYLPKPFFKNDLLKLLDNL